MRKGKKKDKLTSIGYVKGEDGKKKTEFCSYAKPLHVCNASLIEPHFQTSFITHGIVTLRDEHRTSPLAKSPAVKLSKIANESGL